MTATYSGSAVYAGSVSSPVQEVILPGTFTVTLSPSVLALTSGRQGSVQINLASMTGFAGPLILTAGSTPTYTNATINPASVTLTAGGSGSATSSSPQQCQPVSILLPRPA